MVTWLFMSVENKLAISSKKKSRPVSDIISGCQKHMAWLSSESRIFCNSSCSLVSLPNHFFLLLTNFANLERLLIREHKPMSSAVSLVQIFTIVHLNIPALDDLSHGIGYLTNNPIRNVLYR